jgi:hypothetical protein
LLKMIKDFKANKISETPRLLKIMSLISRWFHQN